jgi:effector-binding domain-containing protein
MAPAYEALARWVREHGHAVAGPSWEVYGDWTADASQLETDIYVLLG